MSNPFTNKPDASKWQPSIYMDPQTGVWYKSVKSGDFSFSEELPEDEQYHRTLGILDPSVAAPDPGQVPAEMALLVLQGGVGNDVLIATSAKSYCDTNARYNENVVQQGYLNALRYWIPNKKKYKEPEHPAQYYRLCNYAVVYELMRAAVDGGKALPPLPPAPNYQLVRK